ncbi:ous-pairing protein 2 [Fasciola hepatica]|uniref:Homologous-pairing protein 2 homolog n=1 Tax=Fasciola hepatica TaxID=6192 RepID=A0A4E0RZG2_FASHE|nr:ous-pairing protein 2 [Fasciola hepatica]
MHGKTGITKAIDELVAEGPLREKVYGKQKVFVFDQSRLPAFDEAELKSMENEINQLSRQLEEEQQLVRSINSELRKVSSGLTKAEALAEMERIDQQLKSAESELSKLRQMGPSITEDQLEMVTRARDRYVSEWRKRKRMAMNIVDAVAEGYPKSKKQLIIDIGIETDEDCGVQIPAN